MLSREHTDEWKGWMQAVILVYHYTHGSTILWIYEAIRLLVASYLFLTGFGHTLNFLKKSDYSLKRVASVLIRLNLLSSALPFMMNTDYQFYYFAPLVSFWFIIIYLTLKIGRQYNSSLRFIISKVFLSATCTTAFTKLPGIVESVSLVLGYGGISLNAAEWRFRTFLDIYIVYVGMLFAAVYHRIDQMVLANTTPIVLTSLHKGIVVVSAVLALFLYLAACQMHTNKQHYNAYQHPYLSGIPILSFIVLRYYGAGGKQYYSTAYAALGRCSLETFVLQYHIWLAGDTIGLLRIGWNGTGETFVLTVAFIYISWRMAEATQKLTGWIVAGL
jgi:hypothetical protein